MLCRFAVDLDSSVIVTRIGGLRPGRGVGFVRRSALTTRGPLMGDYWT